MNAPALPGPLNDNPMLDRWVSFPAPGKVSVNTGRVEIGQGVLTAMLDLSDGLAGDAGRDQRHHREPHRARGDAGGPARARRQPFLLR